MKKLQVLSVLVMILAMVIIGCQNGTQEGDVGNYSVNHGSAPTDITAALVTGSDSRLIVKWTAAKNADDYNIYIQQDGKNTTINVDYSTGQNDDEYAAGGSPTPNTNIDAWSDIVNLGGKVPVAGSYKVGVSTNTLDNNESKIAWGKTPVSLIKQ